MSCFKADVLSTNKFKHIKYGRAQHALSLLRLHHVVIYTGLKINAVTPSITLVPPFLDRLF